MNIADSPAAAATTWKTKPSDVPASEIRPASRPWHSVRDTRYSKFGPGVIARTTLAAAKSRRLSVAGMNGTVIQGHREDRYTVETGESAATTVGRRRLSHRCARSQLQSLRRRRCKGW